MTGASLPGCCAVAGLASFLGAFGATAGGSRRRSGAGPFSRLADQCVPVAEARRLSGLRRRRACCLGEMPEFLDVVTLGLSAGLSFDAALGLYCSRFGTNLAEELRGAMLSWEIGMSGRGEALSSLADELGIDALGGFATAVEEALAFGSPLAGTLERQAQAMRDEQRSQVEEEIEKVPVKMLIPLGTLIVPAMLLAIVGPLVSTAVRIA